PPEMARAPSGGLADRRVAEAEQMPELVHHDRLEIHPIGLPIGSDRERESTVEKDVRFRNLTGRGVDQEARGAQHAIEVRAIDETEHRLAVDPFSRRGGHRLE